ncbi:MAG: glycosyltransferase, partial [Kiritimatiellae bacterium]|nr:glycosyltransferase [Kiritimatiellia bacterium]
MHIKNWYQNMETHLLLERHVTVLRESGLFDEAYYLEQNPDVAAMGVDPIRHYLLHGASEHRKPNPFFSTTAYAQLNPDVTASGVNPLVHYVLFGRDEGRTAPRLDTAAGFLAEKLPQNGTLLFLSHNADRGGAQKLLLDYLRWLKQNTTLDLRVICLDGGYHLPAFQKTAPVLIFHDVSALYPEGPAQEKIVRTFAGGNVQLIFGNSLASAAVYDLLTSLFPVPVITHAHELEHTIENLIPPSVIQQAQRHTTQYVACSKAVARALTTCMQADPARIRVIYEYIPAAFNPPPATDRKIRHDRAGLRPDIPLIVGCGNVHWRKGPDLFIRVAEEVLNQSKTDVQFVWVGDFRSGVEPDFGDWERLREEPLKDKLFFVGGQKNPRDYFSAADCFLLPSREDPFPVACLEAAACGLPVVCFDQAGGMPEYVGADPVRGSVVPQDDIPAMARACMHWIAQGSGNHDACLARHRTIISQYTDAQRAPELLHLTRSLIKAPPRVSVIIPSFNYAHYLPQRIESILAQTFQDFELILLDDASSDHSREILQSYDHLPHVRLAFNETNSGGVFQQWRKGLLLARGDLVWIAEADDYCEPELLEALLPFFDDPEITLAYALSEAVNEQGQPLPDFNYQKYVEEFSATRWQSDYTAAAPEELRAGLALRNTIPNASAVVFRRERALPLLDELTAYSTCGDWFLYTRLIEHAGVGYRSRRLNSHRLHGGSVVSKTVRSMAYFEDVLRLYNDLLERYRLDLELRERMIAQLHKEWIWLMP